MSDYVIMPKEDYCNICESVRNKCGKSDPLKSCDIPGEIENLETGGGGASFNIHYGLNPPEDTSMLWVETESEPTSVECGVDVMEGGVNIDVLSRLGNYYVPGAGIASVGSNIYVFGGNPNGGTNTILLYDTEYDTASTLSQTLPNGLYCQGTCAVGTKIYMFGGQLTSTTYSDAILCFNTETNSFEALQARLPTVNMGMACAAVGNKIYLFSGYNNITGFYQSVVVYDIDNDTCEALSVTMPEARNYCRAGVLGTKIYLFGGAKGSTYYNSIYVFDTVNQGFTTLSITLPAKASHLGVALINNAFYLIGGYNNSKISTVTKFVPETNEIGIIPDTTLTYGGKGQAVIVGTKAYFIDEGNTCVQRLSVEFSDLSESKLYICLSTSNNIFTLVNGDDKVNIGASGVFLGNADNKAELAKAYLHNGTTWEGI